MSKAVVWFRNDLRLRDNPVLNKAIEKHEQILPVFIFDERYWQKGQFNHIKTGKFRTHFLKECVRNLQENIESKGGKIQVAIGKSEDILADLCRAQNISAVYAQEEVCTEEKEIEKAVEEAISCELRLIWTSTLFNKDSLPFDAEKIPDVFTQFRKKAEKYAQIDEEIKEPQSIKCPDDWKPNNPNLDELPSEEISDERAVLNFKGGEQEAWKRIQHYFWESQELKNYKFKRNGLLGADFSSKLSPWLAFGCISPVSINHEVQKFEQEIKKNVSTYWLIFELMWRDFFRFVCLKYGSRVFHSDGIRSEGDKWDYDDEIFTKWKEGKTGVPFVDANMRELMQTGYMSNRGRQNVASFLVKDLKQDWRAGAEWFESQLIDHDVCSNYANWNYVSGIGNDPRDNRYFNVVIQAKKYDSKAKYIKTWLPELQDADAADAIEPWQNGLFKVDYPEPIVRGRFMK